MRLLLLSDTHGHLELVERLVRDSAADAVVHAGDLGFYDEQSVDRLSSRELFLRVVHSDLPTEVRKQAKKLKGDELRDFVRKELPLSDLEDWLRTGRGFSRPTCAVWGNHEDGTVVADLLEGRREVPNLRLIGQGELGPFRLLGLGGNLLPELLEFDVPLTGGRGKVHATTREVTTLLESAPPRREGEIRVLVTHVSPGKVPLVSLLAAALDVDLTVSGHMGSPLGCVWDDFAVREPAEAEARLVAAVAGLPGPLQERLALPAGSAERARWYRGIFHINLPDAPQGHVVLEHSAGRLRVETVSHGFVLPARLG